MAVGGHPGALEHPVDLAPQHRDAGDRLGVGGLRVQAEEPVLADDLARLLAEPADRHVVQVAGPVDGRERGRLGEHEEPRPLLAVPAARRGDGERVRAVVAEDAEAGAWHGLQLRLVRVTHQVVRAVAEEGEVAGRQPGEQLAGLGLLRAAVGEQLDEVAGGGPHAALVLHRDPQVVEDAAQVARPGARGRRRGRSRRGSRTRGPRPGRPRPRRYPYSWCRAPLPPRPCGR